MRGAAGDNKSGKQGAQPRIGKILTLPDEIDENQGNGIIGESDQQIRDDM